MAEGENGHSSIRVPHLGNLVVSCCFWLPQDIFMMLNEVNHPPQICQFGRWMAMQEGDMLVQHVGIVTQVPGCQSPDRCSNCMWDLSVLDDFQRLYRLHPSYKYNNRYNYN